MVPSALRFKSGGVPAEKTSCPSQFHRPKRIQTTGEKQKMKQRKGPQRNRDRFVGIAYKTNCITQIGKTEKKIGGEWSLEVLRTHKHKRRRKSSPPKHNNGKDKRLRRGGWNFLGGKGGLGSGT